MRGARDTTHPGWEGVAGTLQLPHKGRGGAGADLFSLATQDRARGKGRKICQGRLRLDRRKRFFSQRVVEHWNKLPREGVTAPSLTILKKHLDNALRHMG